MKPSGSKLLLRIYIGLLVAGLALGVAGLTSRSSELGPLGPWILLTVLFALAESSLILFMHEKGRQSLSLSDTVLFPLIVGFSLGQTVLAITIAMIGVRVISWKEGPDRFFFNIAQFGLAAAAGGGVWHLLQPDEGFLSIAGIAVAVLAAIVFSLVSYALTAGAITLAEGAPFFSLLRQVAQPTVWSLMLNVALGLMFAASFIAEPWTAALFPLPLTALFLGYRAILRQSSERERVEHLYRASRSLASSPDIKRALVEFLSAVTDIVSSSEARVILRNEEQIQWSGVRAGEAIASLDQVTGGPMLDALKMAIDRREPVIIAEDDGESLTESFNAQTLILVPLIEGDVVRGCLLAIDRVGTDEFDDADVSMLGALANELIVTLDSHRLFEQVATERERFQRIFESSREGICLLDAHGVVHAWNPALERMTGHSADQLLGRVWSEVVVVRDREEKRIDGLAIIEAPPDVEIELVTREGPTRWICVTSGPVQGGSYAAWVVLVRDVTAEHQAEEAKSDFLSTISHELRTPLTTIKGSLMVLARDGGNISSELREQMVGVLQRGSDRLERLVMNLLTVSQLESSGGEIRVFNEEIGLDPIVESAAKRVLVEHSSVEMIWSARDVTVRADRERIGQAIEHLLDNALKYGDPEGTITVTVSKANGWGLVAVTDEGPGVPEVDRERIFDRFVRLGDVLTREKQGAGVGLYIARRSAEAMGGGIDIESEPGVGSTFTLRVPLSRPEMVKSQAS